MKATNYISSDISLFTKNRAPKKVTIDVKYSLCSKSLIIGFL